MNDQVQEIFENLRHSQNYQDIIVQIRFAYGWWRAVQLMKQCNGRTSLARVTWMCKQLCRLDILERQRVYIKGHYQMVTEYKVRNDERWKL